MAHAVSASALRLAPAVRQPELLVDEQKGLSFPTCPVSDPLQHRRRKRTAHHSTIPKTTAARRSGRRNNKPRLEARAFHQRIIQKNRRYTQITNNRITR